MSTCSNLGYVLIFLVDKESSEVLDVIARREGKVGEKGECSVTPEGTCRWLYWIVHNLGLDNSPDFVVQWFPGDTWAVASVDPPRDTEDNKGGILGVVCHL